MRASIFSCTAFKRAAPDKCHGFPNWLAFQPAVWNTIFVTTVGSTFATLAPDLLAAFSTNLPDLLAALAPPLLLAGPQLAVGGESAGLLFLVNKI